MVFGFHEPYRVLLDPTFIHIALEAKVQIREQLGKILGTRRVFFLRHGASRSDGLSSA